MRIRTIVPAALAALVIFSAPLRAQRINEVGFSASAVAAADDNPRVTGLGTGQVADDYTFTWGFYPALDLTSRGERSLLGLRYAFGLNRVDSELDLDSESHQVGLNYTYETEKWVVELADSFSRSPDFATFNLFHGIVFTPEGMFFDYETLALRRNRNRNTASVDLRRRIGEHSWLTFGGGHSLVDTEADPLFQRRLTDQSQATAHLGFSRDLSSRFSLETRYNFSHYNFNNDFYGDSRQHAGSLNIRYQAAPTVRLWAGAGPAYTEQIGTGSSFVGYNVNAGVSKEFERQFVTLSYARRSGASVGIGSLSETDHLNFGFSQQLARRVSADFGLSAYRTRRLFDNIYDFEGLSSSLSLNFLLGRYWSLSVGASYQTQEEISDEDPVVAGRQIDFDRRRAFVSLRFNIPNLGRF
jgi:hypothetical protein